MTVGRTQCRRAFDLDLVAFVHDARGAHWADFREHYPVCIDCSVEVRTWTELEIVLQGGAPPATAHPTPDDLLHLESGGSALDPDYRRVVEFHVASCRPCADEIATLRAFDFASLNDAATGPAVIAEAQGSPESPVVPRGLVAAESLFTDTATVEPRADSALPDPADSSPVGDPEAEITPEVTSAAGAPELRGPDEQQVGGADEEKLGGADEEKLGGYGERELGGAGGGDLLDASGEVANGDEARVLAGVGDDEPHHVGEESPAVTEEESPSLGYEERRDLGDEAPCDARGAEAPCDARGEAAPHAGDEAAVTGGTADRDDEEESAVEVSTGIDAEPEALGAPAGHGGVELAFGAEAASEDEPQADSADDLPSSAREAEGSATRPGSVSDGGFLPPEALVEGFGGAEAADVPEIATRGFGRRLAQGMRHPATGVSLVVALLVPVLWVGKVPNFPFGAPAVRVPSTLPEVRVAVATVDDPITEAEFPVPGVHPSPLAEDDLAIEFPSALSGVEAEALPPPEAEPDVRVALARTDLDGPAPAPGLLIPDETAEPSDAVDPWALTRLDREGPVEIVATDLVAGLELEVPVPLTVPAGAVLQVQIRGQGAREIVERLSFPGAQQIALRVPAAWLVPGTYQVDVGVIRRGPAPIQVASYTLVVH